MTSSFDRRAFVNTSVLAAVAALTAGAGVLLPAVAGGRCSTGCPPQCCPRGCCPGNAGCTPGGCPCDACPTGCCSDQPCPAGPCAPGHTPAA